MIIPRHVSSKREIRDGRIIIVLLAMVTMFTALFGWVAGNGLALFLAVVFGILTLWFGAAHTMGERE